MPQQKYELSVHILRSVCFQYHQNFLKLDLRVEIFTFIYKFKMKPLSKIPTCLALLLKTTKKMNATEIFRQTMNKNKNSNNDC